MWDGIRLSVVFVAMIGFVLCWAKGWAKQRLALANRDPRIPGIEFNGPKKAHYTPTGQAYLKQAHSYLLWGMVCFAVGLVLGILGKPL